MTQVTLDDGSVMETNLPAEVVADLQAKPDNQPQEPAKPEAQQASQTEDEQPPKAKAEEPQKLADSQPQEGQQRDDKGQFRSKPKPIAKLLEERHSLREENATLKKQLEDLSKKPANAATDGDIQALAEELGADPAVLEKIVNLARKGFKPELPKEVQDLIASNKAQAEAKAEEQLFQAEVTRLQKTVKDELLSKPEVQQKLKELAYSEEKAPDGEEYFKKPLYELFINYVRPETEPGKPSAEPSKGGSKASGKVLDFADIAADEQKLAEFARTATKEQFQKFHAWQLEHEKEPLRKPGY